MLIALQVILRHLIVRPEVLLQQLARPAVLRQVQLARLGLFLAIHTHSRAIST